MTTTGSELIYALEDAYGDIRERHPELPEVVFITGSGRKKRGGVRLGHFCANRWETRDGGRLHEVFVAGESLASGAEEVLTTMLHESAHNLAEAREIKDTSRAGRWHNRQFVKLARELGLDYLHEHPDKSIGFSAVELAETTKKAYRLTLAALDEAITVHIGAPVLRSDPQEGKSASRSLKATCPCERIIRASATVLEEAEITCGACGGRFAS